MVCTRLRGDGRVVRHARNQRLPVGRQQLSDIQDEIDRTYTEHQAAIRASRRKLEGLDPEDPRYDRLLSQVVSGVNELLAFEATIPARREEPARLRSERIVTWTVRLQAAVAVVLAAGAIPGWYTRTWLLVPLMLLAVAVTGYANDIRPQTHMLQRIGAVGCNILGVLVGLLVTGLLTAWFLMLFIPGAVVVIVLLSAGDDVARRVEERS
jgi:hypothetical protein